MLPAFVIAGSLGVPAMPATTHISGAIGSKGGAAARPDSFGIVGGGVVGTMRTCNFGTVSGGGAGAAVDRGAVPGTSPIGSNTRPPHWPGRQREARFIWSSIRKTSR